MPSLARFLAVVAIIGALIYGGLFALATFLDPKPREISVTVPQERFYKEPR
ncbi:MAG TPA: histidine kinase [Xanthobacteraceae bacterium]|nr:histidine kinase [Xanthobacteraceae bacterium]